MTFIHLHGRLYNHVSAIAIALVSESQYEKNVQPYRACECLTEFLQVNPARNNTRTQIQDKI